MLCDGRTRSVYNIVENVPNSSVFQFTEASESFLVFSCEGYGTPSNAIVNALVNMFRMRT